MGRVARAQDERHRRPEAMKIPHSNQIRRAQEARLAARVSPPDVVSVLDAGLLDGQESITGAWALAGTRSQLK